VQNAYIIVVANFTDAVAETALALYAVE